MTSHNDDISSMITDYINDRLSDKDRALVETAIANDADLAADFEFQLLLSDSLKTGEKNMARDELGWARLAKSIASDPQYNSINDNANQDLSQDLSEDLNEDRGNVHKMASPLQSARANISHLWKYAALAAAVIVIGQGGIIGKSMLSTTSDTPNDTYVTVSKDNDSALTLKVALVPTTTEASIRQLFNMYNANIVSGPTTLGLYEITFKTTAEKTTALEQLGDYKDVIESVSN